MKTAKENKSDDGSQDPNVVVVSGCENKNRSSPRFQTSGTGQDEEDDDDEEDEPSSSSEEEEEEATTPTYLAYSPPQPGYEIKDLTTPTPPRVVMKKKQRANRSGSSDKETTKIPLTQEEPAEATIQYTISSAESESEEEAKGVSEQSCEKQGRRLRTCVPTRAERKGVERVSSPILTTLKSHGRDDARAHNRRASMSTTEMWANAKPKPQEKHMSDTGHPLKKASAKDFKNLYLEKFTGDEVMPGYYGYEDWRAQCGQAMGDLLEMADVYLTDVTKRLLLRSYMSGKAATWFTQQYIMGPPTLAQLDTDMRNTYGMTNNCLTVVNNIQSTAKKVEESYEEYARNLQRLARSGAGYAYPFLMETVVRCFARNANAAMFRILASMIPKHGRDEHFFLGPIMSEMIEKLTSVSGNTGAGEVGTVPIMPSATTSISRFNIPDVGSKGKFQGKCFHCGKQGHKKHECRTRKAEEDLSGGGGGNSRNARQRRAEAKAKATEISDDGSQDFHRED